jgi:diguanylate cyclase (GGDEF)-like protein
MKVLVADDDVVSLLTAKGIVEALGHECSTAVDGLDAWEMYKDNCPDVVVTDRAMPGLDGIGLCQRIRAAEKDSYSYIVLLTALGQPGDLLTGMRAGADDYVTKPLQPVELEAALLAATRVTELHAELRRSRVELARQAHTDPLTGLHNRLGLANDLEQMHISSTRYGRSYCLAICDIDYFKRYNDLYGHLAGDLALRTIGALLSSEVRTADRVYRYGGEEFLVLLPEQRLEGAAVAMERITRRLEDLAIEHSGATGGLLTVSIGLAASTPDSRPTSDQLVAGADRALYEAKEQGRNRLVLGRKAERTLL